MINGIKELHSFLNEINQNRKTWSTKSDEIKTAIINSLDSTPLKYRLDQAENGILRLKLEDDLLKEINITDVGQLVFARSSFGNIVVVMKYPTTNYFELDGKPSTREGTFEELGVFSFKKMDANFVSKLLSLYFSKIAYHFNERTNDDVNEAD